MVVGAGFPDASNMSHTNNAPGPRAWLGLLIVLGPVLLVSMDGSILFLAMPRINQALAPSTDQALWTLDVYGFAVGSLLIVFGHLGDRHGRRRLLMIGATLFGVGSTAAAFAPTPELLIAARALMGVAGATLLPSALAVLSELFVRPTTTCAGHRHLRRHVRGGVRGGPDPGRRSPASGSGGDRCS